MGLSRPAGWQAVRPNQVARPYQRRGCYLPVSLTVPVSYVSYVSRASPPPSGLHEDKAPSETSGLGVGSGVLPSVPDVVYVQSTSGLLNEPFSSNKSVPYTVYALSRTHQGRKRRELTTGSSPKENVL